MCPDPAHGFVVQHHSRVRRDGFLAAAG